MRKLGAREGSWSHRQEEVREQGGEVPGSQVVGEVMGHESPGHGHLLLQRAPWPVSLEETCALSQEGNVFSSPWTPASLENRPVSGQGPPCTDSQLLSPSLHHPSAL